MNLNEADLIELTSLARQGGSISMEDLRKVLPIDSMTAEDLSHVLARLDEAGFELAIDPTLLRPEDNMAQKGVTPLVTREQTGLPETAPERSEQRTSLPAPTGKTILKNHAIRRSEPAASAPMLPWILAFAIVVLAVFAAFAF